ncbi:MAG: hypothetical protein JXM73_04660 [Anaerolineae bacterium]|nr:hypothetical protein [Anaerolineae bacterium]
MKHCTCAGVSRPHLRGYHHRAQCPLYAPNRPGWSQDLRYDNQRGPSFHLHVAQTGISDAWLSLVPKRTSQGLGYKAELRVCYRRRFKSGATAIRQSNVEAEAHDWLAEAAQKVLVAAGWAQKRVADELLWQPPQRRPKPKPPMSIVEE